MRLHTRIEAAEQALVETEADLDLALTEAAALREQLVEHQAVTEGDR